MTRLIAAFLVLLATAGISYASDMPELKRPRVASVSFDYPGDLPKSLPGLVEIKPGDLFSPKAVRKSIRLIYLMGMFRNIIVDGEETPEGLALTFRLIPKKRISDVEVEGADELSTGDVINVMSIKEGDYLDDKLIEKSLESIRRLMSDSGLKDGTVDILQKDVDNLNADLVVVLHEGKPAVVKDIKFEGYLALPENKLRSELEFCIGDVLTKEDLEKSVENLTDLYVSENYVNVSIDTSGTSYGVGAAHVIIKIDAGPRIEVSFEGNEEFSDKTLKSKLSFWKDRDLSPENTTENLDKLVEFYQESGYYYAAITVRTEQSSNPPRIAVRFIIVEGPRSKLESITFSGNKSVDRDELLNVMELSESSVFKSRYITDKAVAEDVKHIKSLYESKGFLEAEVKADNIDFTDDGTEASLHIDINEGPRTIIEGVKFEGNSGIPADKLSTAVKQGKGTPYNPQFVSDYKNNILNMYSQEGYIHATVDYRADLSEDHTRVTLVFIIKEGIPVRIGNIILRGNTDTRDIVILRELLFKPGGVYDYEKILRSQQRIFKLGFMSQVKIQPVNPDKIERVKDLLVSVKERDAGAVEFGAGYGEYDQFRGFAEVSYGNLFGYGHRVSARGELSTKETKVILGYRWPWFAGVQLTFRSNLVYLNAQKPNYKIRDTIASAGFDKNFGEHLTTSLFYQYERLSLNAPAGAVLAIEDRKKSNLASFTPSAVYDLRDNPFNPTKGSVHAMTVKWASSAFGSTVNFVKATAQTSWYFPVYKGIVYGISARGGVEGWFSSKVEVPISERFFLGGASSLRGYEFESVTPRSPDGTPIGGDRMALFNTELRFPLPYGFGIVGFLDAGNVWLDNKNATYTKEWKDKYGNDTHIRTIGGLRYGAGLGLRYETPVGPLRLDYGFKLNPRGDESRGVLHFTLGQAF